MELSILEKIFTKKKRSGTFSHSLCPDCVKKLYPDIADRLRKK
jgi:hypothetical protein